MNPEEKNDWALELRFSSERDRMVAAETLPVVFEELGALGLEEPPSTADTPALLLAYFPSTVRSAAIAKRVREVAKNLRKESLIRTLPKISPRAVAQYDWVGLFRETFRGFDVAPGLRVVPPWKATPKIGRSHLAEEIEIIIDPGMAFGTGMHETTRLCLRLLQREIRGGERIADIGAGSGILSIAAVRLGARSAYAVEFDPQAHENLHDNIRLNRTGRRIRVIPNDGVSFAKESQRRRRCFDLIVCNMLPQRMEPLWPHFSRLVHPRRTAILILSGHLWINRKEISQRLKQEGMVVVCERKKGEWGAIVARMEASHVFAKT